MGHVNTYRLDRGVSYANKGIVITYLVGRGASWENSIRVIFSVVDRLAYTLNKMQNRSTCVNVNRDDYVIQLQKHDIICTR